MKRKFTSYRVVPISLEKLVTICNAIKDLNRKDAIAFGDENGMTHHNIDALRQMLGYTNNDNAPKLTAEQRDDIAREYEDGGISMGALARKYGMNYNSIRCILLNRDVTITTSKKWTKRQELFLVNELNKNTPKRKICEMMGKSKASVNMKIQRMKRDGVIKES